MKKLLILCLFAATSFSLFAQPAYEKSFELVYQISQSENYKNYYGIEMINGVRLKSDLLFCGIGIGYGRGTYAAWDTKGYKDEEYKLEYETTSLVPVYGRAKINLSRKSIAPFIAGNLGYVFDVGDTSLTHAGGLYTEANFGVDIALQEDSVLYLMVGAVPRHSQEYFKNYNSSNEGIIIDLTTTMISFRVGLVF